MRGKTGIVLAFLIISLARCASGPRIALDPESGSFYETARLIMSGEERNIFSHLPDAESRKEFISEFWAKRDPDPDTEVNEFKEEFFARINYANKHFKEGIPGWKTDRGRIYIYMGPPDKFEEFFTHDDSEVRGSILWWMYYDYELGIEFADEKGFGQFRIRQYTGDFFGAMEKVNLGQVARAEEGLKRTFVDFSLRFDPDRKEIKIGIPAKAFQFWEEEGNLKAVLQFEFFVYSQDGPKKDRFAEEKVFEMPEEEVLRMKDIVFIFPYVLEAGNYYIDAIIIGKNDSLGKTRKIFEIKV